MLDNLAGEVIKRRSEMKRVNSPDESKNNRIDDLFTYDSIIRHAEYDICQRKCRSIGALMVGIGNAKKCLIQNPDMVMDIFK